MLNTKKQINTLIITFFLFLFSALANAEGLKIPPLSGPVVDKANLISPRIRAQIESSLRTVKRNLKVQLQVLIIDTLDGEPIENYSIRTVEKWKLGTSKEDKGLLFLIAVKDRKMRIEVGQGLEGEITDIFAARIIQHVRPYFKKGDYNSGIVVALSAITQQLGGKFEIAPNVSRVHNRSKRIKNGSGLVHLLVMLFILVVFGRGRGGGTGWFLLGMLSGSSRGGFGGGGSSGGSWGGGGGGFSGGGSSGSW
jgi:uncharacterized protein